VRDRVRGDFARRVVRGRHVFCCRGPAARGAIGGDTGASNTGASTTAAAARVEELHVVGDDLGGAPLLPVLTLPRAGLDAALDVDQRPLAGVLGHDLGEVSLAGVVGHDVVVVGELR